MWAQTATTPISSLIVITNKLLNFNASQTLDLSHFLLIAISITMECKHCPSWLVGNDQICSHMNNVLLNIHHLTSNREIPFWHAAARSPLDYKETLFSLIYRSKIEDKYCNIKEIYNNISISKLHTHIHTSTKVDHNLLYVNHNLLYENLQKLVEMIATARLKSLQNFKSMPIFLT